MTILVSLDPSTGTMRRYDTRVKDHPCRYICDDLDWSAVCEAGDDRAILNDFYKWPLPRYHVAVRPHG